MAKGFQGTSADAYTKLLKKYINTSLDTRDIVFAFIVAEQTSTEPDAILQRWVQLFTQAKSAIYGTELPE
jgi:hypothetical protein